MRGKRILLFALCIVPFFLAMPLQAVAGTVNSGDAMPEEPAWEEPADYGSIDRFGTTSPWLSGTQDESIYGNAIVSPEELQDISVKEPGMVEKGISELVRNTGSALISLLQDSIGASLDRVVYGRVGSGRPDMVNVYAFELRKGNPYGVAAAVCYTLLRGMMFIFLGIGFVFRLAKAAWSGQTARSRDEIKSMFPDMAAKFIAMVLMPHLLDVALYVRDVLLYGIKEVTGLMAAGGATLSLSEVFLYNAEQSGTFVDAVMYLGTVFLTIYFVFLYVAVAIDMLVCFVSFPFICVLHSRKKDLIGSWVMTMFSDILTPVIDAVLLLVPLLTSLMLSDVVKGVAVIQLVMCMLIIPARSRFKALLGIQGNERNGFLGAMAVMSLGRALAGRIRQGAGKIAEAFSDAKKSRMHGELAEVDREEEESLLSGGVLEEPGKEGNGGLYGGAEPGQHMQDEAGPAEEMEEDGLEPEASGKGAADSGMKAMDGMEDMDETDDKDAAVSMDRSVMAAGTRNDALRELDRRADAAQETVDSLRAQKAELAVKEKQIKRKMLDQERGSEAYKQLEKERADVENTAAQIDRRIAAESGKLNSLRAQSRQMHGAMGSGKVPTPFDERRAEILRKRASIANFEQPEFRNVLSNEQMQALYRRRAAANAAKAVTGTVGAAAFGTAAGAASLFLGPSGAVLAAAGGIKAGGSIGETAVDAAAVLGSAAGPAIRSAGTRIQQAADACLEHRARQGVPLPAVSGPGAPPAAEPFLDTQVLSGQPGADTVPAGISMAQVAADANAALQNVMTASGNIKSGMVLRAMQQANVQLEKEMAVLQEESGAPVAVDVLRERRIVIQTEAVSRVILQQMQQGLGYGQGSDAYTKAESYVRDKVKGLFESRDKPLV